MKPVIKTGCIFRNAKQKKIMKSKYSLLLGLILLVFMGATAIAHERVHSKFLGVCQKCARDIYAYWRPVECLGGGVEWQWVEDPHCHCRPAYKGPKPFRLIDSPWVNPGNKKGWKHRHCKNKQRCTSCD